MKRQEIEPKGNITKKELVNQHQVAPISSELTNGHKQEFLRKKFQEISKNAEVLEETISFSEFLGRLEKNPNIAQLSHARVSNMLNSRGVETLPDERKSYKFFEEEIFGVEDSLKRLYEYFDGAGDRLEIRKRILLMVGPPGGGKSTIAAMLKRGLERYSKTDEGACYAIKGCPMHEDPLHLIPNIEDVDTGENFRKVVEKEYGVHIEGDLCPHCQFVLANEKKGDYESFEVERLVFSEKERKGIGTFLPSDPKTQDVSELVGSIDFSTIGEYGTESDPRAYKFDGELNIANRGMMEFIEMLKSDEKFLYCLLTLTQEQNIKIPRYPLVYADEVIVTHTNENEYKAFLANPKAEALRDRVYPVLVPYNLRASDEKKIYEKLLGTGKMKIGKDFEKGEVHVAPLTLDVAANFAVLSRLEETKKEGFDLMKKLKLYNGEDVEGAGQNDIKEMKKAAEREGMSGVSPRYVVNCLSTTLDKGVEDEEGKRLKKTCITPLSAVRKLRDGLMESASITNEEKQRIGETILPLVLKEFNEYAKTEVQKAFVNGHEDHAQAIFNNYLDNVDAFCNRKKIKDMVTGEDIEPDEKTMRSLEEQIGVTESQKKSFREEVLIRLYSVVRQGKDMDYKSHPKLHEAIQRKLLADYSDVIKTTLTSSSRNPEQKGRIDKVKEHLISEKGYCPECANELMEYVSQLYKK